MGEFVLELRAVNHRFLDLKLAVAEPLRALEERLRERLRLALGRGRIEAALRWRPPAQAGFVVNRTLALQVGREALHLAGELKQRSVAPLETLALLAWPGVVEAPVPELDAVAADVDAVTEQALAALIAAREREGAALAAAIRERLDRLLEGVGSARVHAQESKATLGERLAARLEALGSEVDSARLAQEAALLVVRQDTSEELDRLAAHAREARRLLDADEAVGRRLDFLMQELAREANTLASKAPDLGANQRALDLKVLIEEMREQVQNVE